MHKDTKQMSPLSSSPHGAGIRHQVRFPEFPGGHFSNVFLGMPALGID
jgi:hypothetical protein